MAAQVSTALYGIERQALEVCRIEYEKYVASQTLTPSYVQLMKATYDMLMKGAAHRAGVDIANKSPREVLVELQQLVVEFQQYVDQENEMAQENTIQ